MNSRLFWAPSSTSSEQRQQASALTWALLRRAALAYRTPVPELEIRFDLRGTAAGQARLLGQRCFLIRYHPELLGRQPERFMARTVPHEVAHVVTFCRFGAKVRPHGPEWRALMGFFGADAARCHDFDLTDLPRRTLRRFPYHCACGDQALTSIRHRRFLLGTRYRCPTCGEALCPGPRGQPRLRCP